MANIVVVGSLNMDLVARAPRIPVVGETIIGDSYFAEPGGKGANQAYAAARLGGKVAMIGCVGTDEFGKRMRDNLSSTGCDVSSISAEHGSSGVALIFVSANGQNSIVVVSGANAKLKPEHIKQNEQRLKNVKVLLLQLESPIPSVIAAAKAARRAGAIVILDPAPAPAHALPAELLQNIDILTPNETEGTALAGLPLGSLDPEKAVQVGNSLRNLGVPTVIMKLGEQGCMVISDKGVSLYATPNVDAIDTTAAGDVFNAALAVALSEGHDLHLACKFANNAAALSVTRPGAQIAAPSRSEVEIFQTEQLAGKAALSN
jgi:ribokinase